MQHDEFPYFTNMFSKLPIAHVLNCMIWVCEKYVHTVLYWQVKIEKSWGVWCDGVSRKVLVFKKQNIRS